MGYGPLERLACTLAYDRGPLTHAPRRDEALDDVRVGRGESPRDLVARGAEEEDRAVDRARERAREDELSAGLRGARQRLGARGGAGDGARGSP
jgi:hypothetical protein